MSTSELCFVSNAILIFPKPGIKLVDFFGQMSAGDLKVTSNNRLDAEAGGSANFYTRKMQDISKAMRDLRPLVSEDVERRVKYWDSMGLFDGM